MSSGEAEIIKEELKKGLLQLWTEESEEHQRKLGEYYPSGIGYCLRRQYYDYQITKPPESETLAIFATGRGIHEAVAEALSRSKEVRIEHLELPTTLQINQSVKLAGRIDLLIAEVLGKRVVLEIKSTSRIPDNPQTHHIMQLQAYLHATGIDTGLLLYWDKRSGQIECFKIQKDQSWLQKIAERAIMLDQHLRMNIPPYREALIEGRYWECDKCLYYSECSPFTISHIALDQKLAIIGISVSLKDDNIILVSPDIDELKELCQKRKSMAERIVILSDSGYNMAEKLSEFLAKNAILHDAIVSKPESYSSPSYWKLEFARRLAKIYRIVYYADSSDFPVYEAMKFSSESERIGNNSIKGNTKDINA